MSASLFVLTAPRKTDDRWEYVRALAKHVDTETIRDPFFCVVDGTADDRAELRQILGAAWVIERYKRPEGSWLGGNKWPYWRLLEFARESTTGDALLLEDDLWFCRSAIERMLLFPTPHDLDAVQFFSAWLFGVPAPKPYPGLWRSPASAPVQGCQAIKFSRRTVERLCDWARDDPEWQKYSESDVSLGLAQHRLGLRFGHHLPDLVQHAGEVSQVSHGNHERAQTSDPEIIKFANRSLVGRVSANWPGRSFDAMRLFSRPDAYR